MMHRIALCSLGVLAGLGGALRADWKITTVTTWKGSRSVHTEYFKGSLCRVDHGNTVSVVDSKNSRQTIWDVTTCQYVVEKLRRAREQAGAPGPTIVIDIETTDTGERRTMFGRTARHLITLERRHEESQESETRRDGWYINSESLPQALRASKTAILVAGRARPVLKVNRKGSAAETGLALWRKITNVSTTAGGQRAIFEQTSEVTELFEGQLDATLFDPPPGFRRVTSLKRQ